MEECSEAPFYVLGLLVTDEDLAGLEDVLKAQELAKQSVVATAK